MFSGKKRKKTVRYISFFKKGNFIFLTHNFKLRKLGTNFCNIFRKQSTMLTQQLFQFWEDDNFMMMGWRRSLMLMLMRSRGATRSKMLLMMMLMMVCLVILIVVVAIVFLVMFMIMLQQQGRTCDIHATTQIELFQVGKGIHKRREAFFVNSRAAWNIQNCQGRTKEFVDSFKRFLGDFLATFEMKFAKAGNLLLFNTTRRRRRRQPKIIFQIVVHGNIKELKSKVSSRKFKEGTNSVTCEKRNREEIEGFEPKEVDGLAESDESIISEVFILTEIESRKMIIINNTALMRRFFFLFFCS